VPVCAICQHLAMPPRTATGTVGLLTGAQAIVVAALDRFGEAGSEQHVVVHACPEHVVDVYRGRIEGVKMAWRLSDEPTTAASLRSPGAASASPA
jgi:hypothetical protein